MSSAPQNSVASRKRSGGEAAPQKRSRLDLVKRLHNKTVRGSNLKDLKADDCTIHGDNNHVIGNFNILIGRNNTAEGTGNTFSVPVEPPPPPPLLPSVQPRSQPAEPQSLVSALTEMGRMLFLAEMGQFPSAQRRLMYSPPPAEAVSAAAPVDEPARPASTEKDSAQWVRCALDLPGEAMPTDSEELRCVVCMENQRDTLFRPCRHLCCCRSCVRALAVQKPKKITGFDCPKCRQSVESMTIVFL